MSECSKCKAVPYIVYEAEQARNERIFKRMWLAIVMMIMLLVGTNIAWLAYERQFETVQTTEETTIDAYQSGTTNIVGGGDVNYGTDSKD